MKGADEQISDIFGHRKRQNYVCGRENMIILDIDRIIIKDIRDRQEQY
jgi:hypothetical protein